MVLGVVVGMILANTLRPRLPESWDGGLKIASKQLLRAGIVLYGFRLTYDTILQIGGGAIIIDIIIVVGTLLIGNYLGRALGLDKDERLLIASGSAICGAAAVLATEPVVGAKLHKTAVAVATVVLFGTLSMFLYPVLYRNGVFPLSTSEMGLFTGATVHEVAHVVGASNAMGKEVADVAVIVKMIRVIMLVPVLLSFGWFARTHNNTSASGERKVVIPWFAFLFLLAIGLNSLLSLPDSVSSTINTLDTFALTMAMTALGCETSFDKFRQAGWRPFVLALVLYIWLVAGGFFIVKGLSMAGFIS